MNKPILDEGARAVANLLDDGLGELGALRRPRIMTLALMILVGAIVFWCMVAPIDRVIRATGRVIPSGKNQVVQHLEGGVVAAIHISEGQLVKAGDLLVEMGDTTADSEVKERRMRASALRAKVARLRAEAEDLPAIPAIPAIPAVPAIPAEPVEDVLAWETERRNFEARRARLQQSASVFEAQLGQRREEVIELRARQQSLEAERNIASRQLDTMQSLLKQRAASDMELLEAQAKLQRLVTQLAEVSNRIPQTQAMILEISERIRSEKAAFRAEARAELATVQTDARGAAEEVRSRDDRLRRTELRAPVSGTVNRVLVNTVGGVVRPGDPVVEITPTDSQIVIEGQVLPTDRAELHPGLPTVVKVGAYDYTVFGALSASVREISADTLSDERGNRYYRTLLTVPAESATKFKHPVLPGMTVTADIVVGQRTVASYLMSSVLRFSSSALRDNH